MSNAVFVLKERCQASKPYTYFWDVVEACHFVSINNKVFRAFRPEEELPEKPNTFIRECEVARSGGPVGRIQFRVTFKSFGHKGVPLYVDTVPEVSALITDFLVKEA